MISLVADYDTTSSSSSEKQASDEDTEEKQSETHSNSTLVKPSAAVLLPSANFLLSGRSSKPTGDVFSNPFLEAEKSEIDKLQKHVKMVESENHLQQKNGRKICWNNRKGRCRFGNKCKYAHDSDLVEAKEVSDGNKNDLNKEMKIPATTPSSNSFEAHIIESDATSDLSKIKKPLKRPGLGDNIVPGKRVMTKYHSMKKSTL